MTVKRVVRLDDYEGRSLALTRTEDGDVGLMIGFGESVTFCSPRSGSISPNTSRALRTLFDAMEEDNRVHPDPRTPAL